MKIEIRSKDNNQILFSCETESIKKAVERAVKNSVDLSSADLRFADLRSADLRFADLRSADLRYANLRFCKGDFIYNYGVKLKVVEE